MKTSPLTRRSLLLTTLAAVPGCSTLSALSDASSPLPTFDLVPSTARETGPRTRSTLLVATPVAPAVLQTDRILVRPGAASVTYLAEARWSEELPSLIQSLLIRSISSTGRIGYVGPSGQGPIPDFAVLTRIDQFDVFIAAIADGIEAYQARVSLSLTIIRDTNQTVLATRSFESDTQVPDLSPRSIVAAFQSILDAILLDIPDWTISAVS